MFSDLFAEQGPSGVGQGDTQPDQKAGQRDFCLTQGIQIGDEHRAGEGEDDGERLVPGQRFAPDQPGDHGDDGWHGRLLYRRDGRPVKHHAQVPEYVKDAQAAAKAQ